MQGSRRRLGARPHWGEVRREGLNRGRNFQDWLDCARQSPPERRRPASWPIRRVAEAATKYSKVVHSTTHWPLDRRSEMPLVGRPKSGRFGQHHEICCLHRPGLVESRRPILGRQAEICRTRAKRECAIVGEATPARALVESGSDSGGVSMSLPAFGESHAMLANVRSSLARAASASTSRGAILGLTWIRSISGDFHRSRLEIDFDDEVGPSATLGRSSLCIWADSDGHAPPPHRRWPPPTDADRPVHRSVLDCRQARRTDTIGRRHTRAAEVAASFPVGGRANSTTCRVPPHGRSKTQRVPD